MAEDRKEKSQTLPRSYCCLCDAAEGECDCGEGRYLDEIVYERVAGGWCVPEGERAVWDEMARHSRVWRTQNPKPKDLDALVEQLDFWLFLGKATRERLERAYGQNPARVTRLVDSVVAGAQSGRLNVPDGYLDKRLKEELAE